MAMFVPCNSQGFLKQNEILGRKGVGAVKIIIWAQDSYDDGVTVLDWKERKVGRWWLTPPARIYMCYAVVLLSTESI